ncbi:wd-40 repeat protein : NDWp3 (Fragment) OS=Podospora anserina PE=4 SV=1: WD40: WD40: WD40 [Gemmataceae bacterium]
MLGPALALLALVGSLADLPPGAVLRLGDPRFRAPGEVRNLRFTPDGATLAGWVARPDGTVRPVAWDAATGFPRDNPFPPPQELGAGAVPSVRVGGTRVLTAGPGTAGRVWDAATGRQLALLAGHSGRVTAVAGSPDGSRLATASSSGLVRVWDGETFRAASDPRGHLAPVCAIRVAPDGSRAATVGADGTVRVWSLATGRELRGFRHPGPVEFTPDSSAVVLATEDGHVRVWDVVTGLERVPDSPPPPPSPTDAERLAWCGVTLAFSPTGAAFAVGYADGTVALFERHTQGLRRELRGHGSACRALAFTPDGSRLLTAGGDHTVIVWDVRPQAAPLPRAVRRETSAAKLWAAMCTGPAADAYHAMARLAVEPDAAVATARVRVRAADAADSTAASRLADSRAVELLEALGTPEARAFLAYLAGGHADAWRTQEARRALERARR